jgi:hypothetical protein
MPPQIFGSDGSTEPSRSRCTQAAAGAATAAGGAGEIGEQIVEAAVSIDHHHVLDVGLELVVERAFGCRGWLGWSRFGQRGQGSCQPGSAGGLEMRRREGLACLDVVLLLLPDPSRAPPWLTKDQL